MKYYDKTKGDCLQGDVILFPLPDGLVVSSDALQQTTDNNGAINLLEGELTGHFHRIIMGPPSMFYNDGAGASVPPASADPVAPLTLNGVARLYRDGGLTRRLISLGELSTDALCIGYLIVADAPVELKHDEHDSIMLPPGSYYVGRQREWTADQERKVED